MIYQIAYVSGTKTVTVQTKGDALPASAVKIGEFTYNAGDNSVFYHYVQEALMAQGVTDMRAVTINHDIDYIAVTGLSITPATVTLAAAATQQLTATFSPASPSNTDITYVSSDPTKATVNSTGLVTAIATGTATITATTADGGFTDTCVVTVS